MGNYHSNADLKARFADDATVAQLTGSDSADTGVPDESVLTEVVNGSEAEAESYIAKRYLVPVAVADHDGLAARMKSLCLDVSVYHLLANAGSLTEDAEKAYEACVAWLKMVAKGEVVLPSPDTEPSSESDEPQVEWGIGETPESGDPDKHNRVFTRSSMSGL